MKLLANIRRLLHRRYIRATVGLLIVTPIVLLCIHGSNKILLNGPDTAQHDLQIITTDGPRIYADDHSKGNDILLTLVRNSELTDMIDTIERFEKSFNSKYHYQWWFMNDEEFTDEFKEAVELKVSGGARFIRVPTEMWSYPPNIDQKKAAASRENYKKQKINYGSSESYRFMCRFNSGLFYKLPELVDIEYYWRIEPSVHFDCEITYDVFKYMRANKKLYAFNMALQEDIRTIPSLWNATMNFFRQNSQYVASKNNAKFITDDDGSTYNLCHFWSNFEIASLGFYRSQAYEDFFKFLDSEGGFFYERWGDAPVHTLAASYMIPAESLHFVANTGYMHSPNQDCPPDAEIRDVLHCECSPKRDFTWHEWSCVNKFFEVNGYVKPNTMANLKKAYPYIFNSMVA
ncbi:glycosyltransferase family 15 protein TDEL_0A02940 [Torulaspora delbrueckii]|uniref:Glycosyltransferase family 15 protein n=1 Tax=Torulaspora delbrueckii TaxID=4950 RepID=G8ZLY2_TORDE|nr:hypothetical protein TDEL_0A02940 [Torulaspora delbrueckii]CCE89626.1 hypothetical protein TDEL_0A02940 [Torulaspora delbrueckii]